MEAKRTCNGVAKYSLLKRRLPNIVVFNAHNVDINNVSARREIFKFSQCEYSCFST